MKKEQLDPSGSGSLPAVVVVGSDEWTAPQPSDKAKQGSVKVGSQQANRQRKYEKKNRCQG